MKELKTIIEQGIACQLATETVTGGAIDLADCNGAVVAFNVGSSLDELGSAVNIVAGLTECATASGSYTAVSASDMIAPAGGLTITSGGTTIAVGYRGSKRFIKPTLTFSGTHSSGTYVGADVVKGALLLAK